MGGSQTTNINLDRHRSGSRTFVSVRGGLWLPVVDPSILHPLTGTGWELQIFAILKRTYVFYRFYWPTIIPQK